MSNPDAPLFPDAFVIEHKYDYIKKEGKYKDAARYEQQSEKLCTICSIVERTQNVPSYEIYRTNNFIIFLNLFPYTSGHTLISPIKHYENYEEIPREMKKEFAVEIGRVIELVKLGTKTNSVNAGWNQGPHAGGSIKHFHAHVVPRFPRELNFVEIIAHSRPMVLSLEKVRSIFREKVKELEDNTGIVVE